MKKCISMVLFILVFILSIQRAVFAADKVQKPPKPTEGIEASDPNHGSSKDYKILFPQSISGLFTDWYCGIYNSGTNLYLSASSTTVQSVEEMKITLYLQKWNGSAWVDINSWTFYGYNTEMLMKDMSSNYQPGNYYRARAEHYAKDGIESDTQYSTSSYIYVP